MRIGVSAKLDVPTLMAMDSFVYAFAGVVLFIAWSQNRKISALALWGLSDIVTAGGVLSLTLGFASGQPLGLILGRSRGGFSTKIH